MRRLSNAIQDDGCAGVSGRRFAALRRYLSEADAAGNVLPSLPAALQCKASSTSHFTRTYLGLRWPNVCKIEKYAYMLRIQKLKRVLSARASLPLPSQIPELALCVSMCVCEIVSVSALRAEEAENSPRQRLPVCPPPVQLHTVGLNPTKGGITVKQLQGRGGGNPRHNRACQPTPPRPTSSFWTQCGRMRAPQMAKGGRGGVRKIRVQTSPYDQEHYVC